MTLGQVVVVVVSSAHQDGLVPGELAFSRQIHSCGPILGGWDIRKPVGANLGGSDHLH